MGHAPSSECCDHEPFVVDFESKGKGHERLVAIALTKSNVVDMQSTLFKGFYSARCDESVRHWYCSDADRSKIKAAPEAAFIWEKFVCDATDYVASAENNDPADFTPLPIALLKLPHDAVLYHENGQLLTTMELLGSNPNFEVVGYFGCRHFSANAKVDNYGTIGMFLSKTFNNEAKSVAILEIACRCYKHFMSMYGFLETPWPTEIHFETLDSNLPCLRLMQKLLVSSQQVQPAEDELVAVHDTNEQRLKVIAKGSCVAKFAEHLAAQVTTSDSITFSLKTRPVEPSPSIIVHEKLDEVICHAKKRWSEANRPVVEAYTAAKLAAAKASETASVSSVAPSTAPFPSLVAPTPLEPSTPVSIVSAPKQQQQQQQQQQQTTTTVTSSPVVTNTYRHCVYDFNVLAAADSEENQQTEEEQQDIQSVSVAPESQIDNNNNNQPFQAEIEAKDEETIGLYLAKRTPISFWKKGRWTSAQWRDEAMVRMCAVQSAENDDLFAVELMYLQNHQAPEISIFDEFNRPAKVRLDRPAIFYVPMNSLYYRDTVSKQYIPFSVATEITPSVNTYENSSAVQQQNSYSNNQAYAQSLQHQQSAFHHFPANEQRRAYY